MHTLHRLARPEALAASGLTALLAGTLWWVLQAAPAAVHPIAAFELGRVDPELARHDWESVGLVGWVFGLYLLDLLLLLPAYTLFLLGWGYALLRAHADGWPARLRRFAPYVAVPVLVLALADGLENLAALSLLSDLPGAGFWSGVLHAAAQVKRWLLVGVLVVYSILAVFWLLAPRRRDFRLGVGDVLWRSKFTLLFLAGYALLLAGMDQTTDAAIRLGEMLPAWVGWPMFLLSLPAVFLFGLASWLWPRLLAGVTRSGEAPAAAPGGVEGFAKWWARLLGLFPFLATALLYAHAARIASGTVWAHPAALTHGWADLRLKLSVLGALYLFAALLFLLLVIYRHAPARRQLLARLRRQAVTAAAAPTATPYYRQEARLVAVLKTMPAIVGTAATGLLAATLALFWPGIAHSFGALNQLLLGLALWSSVLGFLGYLSLRAGLPYLLLALALVGWMGQQGLSENHPVRSLGPLPQPDPRPTLVQAWEGWLLARQAEIAQAETYPVFLVSAEGGGIRAAYWTALVLLHQGPRFAHHSFSLSTVSGSSLGAVVWAACQGRAGGAPAGTAFAATAACIERSLRADHLTPTLTHLLFVDTLAKLVPMSLFCGDAGTDCPDRARAFEVGLEAGNPTLAAPLAAGRGERAALPYLFLNATWVEDGQRAIAAEVRIDDRDFPRARDQLRELGRDLRLSTAAHNSARFPYVSPAGTVFDAAGRVRGHLVDGGYCDNSGAHTSLDILRGLERCLAGECTGLSAAQRQRLAERIRPVAVFISNAPVASSRFAVPCGTGLATAPARSEAIALFAGALAPPVTIYNVFSNHQWQAERALQAVMLESCRPAAGGHAPVYHLSLARDAHLYPLGWVLSEQAAQGMRRQAEGMARIMP